MRLVLRILGVAGVALRLAACAGEGLPNGASPDGGVADMTPSLCQHFQSTITFGISKKLSMCGVLQCSFDESACIANVANCSSGDVAQINSVLDCLDAVPAIAACDSTTTMMFSQTINACFAKASSVSGSCAPSFVSSSCGSRDGGS